MRTVAPREPSPACGTIASRRCFLAFAAACCGVAAWLARTFSLPLGAFSAAEKAPPGPTATVFWRTRWLPRKRRTLTRWPATNGASVPRTRTFLPRTITRSWPTRCVRSSLIESAAGAGAGAGVGVGVGAGGVGVGVGSGVCAPATEGMSSTASRLPRMIEAARGIGGGHSTCARGGSTPQRRDLARRRGA